MKLSKVLFGMALAAVSMADEVQNARNGVQTADSKVKDARDELESAKDILDEYTEGLSDSFNVKNQAQVRWESARTITAFGGDCHGTTAENPKEGCANMDAMSI